MKSSLMKISKDQEKLKTSWFVAFAFSMLALFACHIPQAVLSGTPAYDVIYGIRLSDYGLYDQVPVIKYIRILAVGINQTFLKMLPDFGETWVACMGAWLIAPIFEELEFRGFLWYFNKRLTKFWYVTLSMVSSFIFCLCHNVPPGYCVTIGLVGLSSCWLIRKTGKLWPSILLHSVYNIQIFFMAMSSASHGTGTGWF